MRNRTVRAAALLVAAIVAVVGAVVGFGFVAMAEDGPADVTECLADAPTVPGGGDVMAASLTTRFTAAPEPVKVKCAGKLVDYTMEVDSTNKKVTVTIIGGQNFKGCEFKLKDDPTPGFKSTDLGFEFPFDKADVKVKVEGAFLCKKADGGELVVPVDTLEFTFRPPGTFVLPLK